MTSDLVNNEWIIFESVNDTDELADKGRERGIHYCGKY